MFVKLLPSTLRAPHIRDWQINDIMALFILKILQDCLKKEKA